MSRMSLMPTRSAVHLSSMGPSMHRDSKHPFFQMTVVLLRILSVLPTSVQCAHHQLHSHASFPTSQNAFPPRLTFYSYNNTKKQTEKDEQYLHLIEQSTPGCCFTYLPLQVTCYPLTRLNPREERYRSKFFPNGIIAMTPWRGPQMHAFNSSSLPYDEGSPWRNCFPLRTRQVPFLLSCPTPSPFPLPSISHLACFLLCGASFAQQAAQQRLKDGAPLT